MIKLNKKAILLIIVFAFAFLFMFNGKVNATDATNDFELIETLKAPTINSNVRLIEDIVLGGNIECKYIIKTDSVFDLNGHILTISNEEMQILFENNNCKLTIIDSVGGGKITSKGYVNSIFNISNADGDIDYSNCKVEINGGIYEGPSSIKPIMAAQLKDSSNKIGFTVNEGTFIINYNSGSVFANDVFELTINQMVTKSELKNGNFIITNDAIEISEVISENSDIWVDGIRKYTDNPRMPLGLISCVCESETGIVIKDKVLYDDPLYVETIEQLNDAVQAPEVKTVVLNDSITTSENLNIVINGNEKIIDLNGNQLTLEEDAVININYYTNHDFVVNNDESMCGTIYSDNGNSSSGPIFKPWNFTNDRVNMTVNGLSIETSVDWVFEDEKKFYLTINNGFYLIGNSLFKFDNENESKITINRITIRNLNGYIDDSLIKLEYEKLSDEPISTILGNNSKLVYINYNNELIDQPNNTTCGEAYRGDCTLIVMPKIGLKIEKVVLETREYGFNDDADKVSYIRIKNISDDTIRIRDISLLRDDSNFFVNDSRLNIDEPIEILPGKENGTFSIRPNTEIEPGTKITPGVYKTQIQIITVDEDEYRAQVEFTVTKAHPELSVDISNWTYGASPVEPVREGNIGNGTETFEYAQKTEAGSSVEPVFSETVPTEAGKYIVKYTVGETDLYFGGTATKEFEILRKEVNPEVSGYEDSYTYTGNAFEPEITVKFTDGVETTLVKDKDYTVEYGENINKGQGTITVKSVSTSNYTFADIEKTFNITAKELQEADVEVTDRIGYTGEELTPSVKVSVNEKALVKDTDYTVSYAGQNGEIGSKITVTVEGKGNYSGTVEKQVDIIEKMNQELSFAEATVTKKYNDAKFKIAPIHNVGDGEITYTSSNTNVATVSSKTGEVTIVGVGEANITATASETDLYKQSEVSYKLIVNKADYDLSKIKFSNMSFAYDGKTHSIVATGLPKGVTATYTNNGKTNVGTYQITVSFKGDYEHYNVIPNRTATLTIAMKNIANTIVSGIKDKTYTGKSLKQSITIKDGSIGLKEGIDYTVAYKSNKKIGTATITITGKGNYGGIITKTFKINPKGTSLKKLSAGKKQFKATWKAQKTQTSGYELQYSTDKSFNSGSKKVKITKNKTTSETVKKLKSKKKYYVRIRTFKTVNGKKYCSEWSKVKNIKVK